MSGKYEKMIESIELVKVEIPVNRNINKTFYYNIKLEGIDELLLIETPHPIESNRIVGSRIKYEVDENTNEVSQFIFF